MAHPNIPGGFTSEEARQKAQGGRTLASKRGGTVAKAPVMPFGNIKKEVDEKNPRKSAIARRLAAQKDKEKEPSK